MLPSASSSAPNTTRILQEASANLDWEKFVKTRTAISLADGRIYVAGGAYKNIQGVSGAHKSLQVS